MVALGGKVPPVEHRKGRPRGEVGRARYANPDDRETTNDGGPTAEATGPGHEGSKSDSIVRRIPFLVNGSITKKTRGPNARYVSPA